MSAELNDVYLRRQRHVLADIHIPEWDERFLSRFDPIAFADACADSGAEVAVVFCNTHSGECFWPTSSGKMHERLAGVDAVGAQVERLRDRGLAVCAYYSFIFNNWAYTEHPEWRLVAANPAGHHELSPDSRYGLCCPNHPEYLDFMLRQTEELATGYPFDAFFFDMVFWPDICVCPSCEARYLREEGRSLPASLDWHSAEWTSFQAARERWLTEAFRQIRDRVKESLNVPVFANAAPIKQGWCCGVGDELVALSDLISGDFLGTGSFATLALYARLTPSVLQYMHNISGYCSSVNQLRPLEEQKVLSLAATMFGGQFMAIDAVLPDGSVNPAAYKILSEVFGEMEPYEPYLGGVPLADVGVYWSMRANVDFSDNGTDLDQIRIRRYEPGPHQRAVHGAVAALAEAHLPVGVFTRAQLAKLDDFAVIVLPNVLRMDQEEIGAFSRYVERGGCLYASGLTSLVTIDGTRHDDFLLASVFGAHFGGEETAVVTYIKPSLPAARDWIAPVLYVTHGEASAHGRRTVAPATATRVTVEAGAEIIATTTLPYLGGFGTRDDRAWASIHTSPPWEDTSRPAVIEHRFGAGRVIYSTTDFEADGGSSEPASALFVNLIRTLLKEPPAFQAETHPDVWITAFSDPTQSRIRLCLLNHASRFPVLPVPSVRFRLAAPKGAAFKSLSHVATNEPVEFWCHEDGSLEGELFDLRLFAMLAATYE